MSNSIKFTWHDETGETGVKIYVDRILHPVAAADFAKDVLSYAEENYREALERLHALSAQNGGAA